MLEEGDSRGRRCVMKSMGVLVAASEAGWDRSNALDVLVRVGLALARVPVRRYKGTKMHESEEMVKHVSSVRYCLVDKAWAKWARFWTW